MTLTGVDPNDPTPGVKRELIFGAGTGSVGVTRDVMLYGTKSTAGAATDDVVLTSPIADDEDALRLFGRRSELYSMYRTYVSVDPSATIWATPIAETGGAARCTTTLTFVGVSDNTSTCYISVNGIEKSFTIEDGDAIATMAINAAALINAMDDGKLGLTAAPVLGVATLTTDQADARAQFLIGDTATRGVRVRLETKTGTQTTTVAKGALAAGTGQSDADAALAAASATDKYYHVFPFHTSDGDGVAVGGDIAVATTDTGLGAALDMINTQSNPSNSKELQGFFGLVGTSANSVAVTEDVLVNNVRAKFMWQENSDLTPAQLAAINCALHRRAETAHPAANVTGYQHTSSTPFPVPDTFVAADAPTPTEIRTALNNGFMPVGQGANGGTYLVRSITSRWSSDVVNSIVDYKAREGHIPSVMDFAWGYIKSLWNAQKQDFVADDLKNGEKPRPNTTYPAGTKAMIQEAIADLAGPTPLGLYTGPILSPDRVDLMQEAVKVTKITGGITVQAELYSAEHLLKFQFKGLEVGDSY